VEIQRIQSANDPAFQNLLRIYTDSIPASERKSPGDLVAMLARPEYIFLTASTNNITTAFAIAINLKYSPKGCLLEYLAVDPAHRNQGLGQCLFQALTELPELKHCYVSPRLKLSMTQLRSDESPSTAQLAFARSRASPI
jgi:predicted N-acetyltransferase YhbS